MHPGLQQDPSGACPKCGMAQAETPSAGRDDADFYNAIGISRRAGVLYPFFGLLLSPVIAGAALSLSSVFPFPFPFPSS